MKVLSLFDGISCARVALERAGIKVDAYYASEVDKYATQTSQKNYPDIIQLGSVVDLNWTRMSGDPSWYTNGIDLLIGGSPCQDLSIAKKNRKGLNGERSGLFWEYVRIIREVKPKYFILENVASMPKEAKAIITKELGVEPIMIDATLVSGQLRKRLFWTNIKGITLPRDREVFLKDIICSGFVDREKSYCLDANYWKGTDVENYLKKGRRQIVFQYRRGIWRFNKSGKCPTLTANMGTGGHNVPFIKYKDGIRKLIPIECERLQGLPDNYTEGVSNTQRYKCLGNAFNVDVVAHILSFIPKN